MPSPADLSALSAALETFIIAKQAARCTERTIQHYRWTLDRFIAWLPEQRVTTAEQITPHIWRVYLVYLQAAKLQASSVRDAARIVKTWLRFLHADGLLVVDLSPRLTLPKADSVLLPAFTPADVHKLMSHARNLRDEAVILCLLDTGCRVSEFCALNVGDVEVTTGTVTIRQGKGRKDRLAYIGAKAKRALLKYLRTRTTQDHDPLFATPDGDRLTVDGLQSMLARLGARAGVQHCHPHTFRRTFALWSLRAGMNVYALQRLMGHTDLSILRPYLALAESDLQTAHQQHGAVDATL